MTKRVPATSTWSCAVRGGGLADDEATSLAVCGTSVYVTGSFNPTTDTCALTLAGSGGTCGNSSNWVAVSSSGTSVYLTGYILSNAANAAGVTFGKMAPWR